MAPVRYTFGVIGYARKLTDEEVYKWELEYLGSRD
jgi:hypothetical protein